MTQIKLPIVSPEVRYATRLEECRQHRWGWGAVSYSTEQLSRREEEAYSTKCVLKLLAYMGFQKKTATIIWESIKTVAMGILLIAFIILFFSLNNDNPEHVEPKYKTFPVMVWTNHLWAPKRPTIYCNGRHRCDVYSMRSQPAGSVAAYLFDGLYADYDDLPLPRDPNSIWALAYHTAPLTSLELFDERALNLFNFSSTFSSSSDMPFRKWSTSVEKLRSLQFYVNVSTKNSLNMAPVLYPVSNCASLTQRDEYVTKLKEYIPIDSTGHCSNIRGFNVNLMNYKYEPNDFYHIKDDISKYKFVIIIEDAVCDDLIENGLWVALEVGTVPIYFGSPSVSDWLPNEKSAILIENYPTPKLLGDYLNRLNENDTEYEQYLEHKTKMQISNYQLFHALTSESPTAPRWFSSQRFECFVCSKLHRQEVGMVTKKHLNCSMKSALTLREDKVTLDKVRRSVDVMYNMLDVRRLLT